MATNVATVPGWRKAMGIPMAPSYARRLVRQRLGQMDYSDSSDVFSASYSPLATPTPAPIDTSGPLDLTSAGVSFTPAVSPEVPSGYGYGPSPVSSAPALYPAGAVTPAAPSQTYDIFGPTTPAVPSSSILFCQSGCSAVTYGNGQKGFFDPSDGTYYDSQGNDVTTQISAYGGAKVGGPASQSAIAAAEGLQTSAAAPAGGLTSVLSSIFAPSPKATVPGAAGTGYGATNIATAGQQYSTLASWLMPILLIGGVILILGKK